MNTIFDKEIEEKLHKDIMRLKTKDENILTKKSSQTSSDNARIDPGIHPKDSLFTSTDVKTKYSQRSKLPNLILGDEFKKKIGKIKDDNLLEVLDIYFDSKGTNRKSRKNTNKSDNRHESKFTNLFPKNINSGILKTYVDKNPIHESVIDTEGGNISPVMKDSLGSKLIDKNSMKFTKLFEDFKNNYNNVPSSHRSVFTNSTANGTSGYLQTLPTPSNKKISLFTSFNDPNMSTQANKIRSTLEKQWSRNLPSISNGKTNESSTTLGNKFNSKDLSTNNRKNQLLFLERSDEDSNSNECSRNSSKSNEMSSSMESPPKVNEQKITNIVNNVNPTNNDKKVEINFNQYDIKILKNKTISPKENENDSQNYNSDKNANDTLDDNTPTNIQQQNLKNKLEKQLFHRNQTKKTNMPTKIVINNALSKKIRFNLNNKDDMDDLNIDLNETPRDSKQDKIKISISNGKKSVAQNKIHTKDNLVNSKENEESNSDSSWDANRRQSFLKRMTVVDDKFKNASNSNSEQNSPYLKLAKDLLKSKEGKSVQFVNFQKKPSKPSIFSKVSASDSSDDSKDKKKNKKDNHQVINLVEDTKLDKSNSFTIAEEDKDKLLSKIPSKALRKSLNRELTKISELSNMISKENENDSSDPPFLQKILSSKNNSNDDLNKKKSKFVNVNDLNKINGKCIQASDDEHYKSPKKNSFKDKSDNDEDDQKVLLIQNDENNSFFTDQLNLLGSKKSFFSKTKTKNDENASKLESTITIISKDSSAEQFQLVKLNLPKKGEESRSPTSSSDSPSPFLSPEIKRVSLLPRMTFTKTDIQGLNNPLLVPSHSISTKHLISRRNSVVQPMSAKKFSSRSNSFIIVQPVELMKKMDQSKQKNASLIYEKVDISKKGKQKDILERANKLISEKCKNNIQTNLRKKKRKNLYDKFKIGFADLILNENIITKEEKGHSLPQYIDECPDVFNNALRKEYADFLVQIHFDFDFMQKKAFIENYLTIDFINNLDHDKDTLIKNFRIVQQDKLKYTPKFKMSHSITNKKKWDKASRKNKKSLTTKGNKLHKISTLVNKNLRSQKSFAVNDQLHSETLHFYPEEHFNQILIEFGAKNLVFLDKFLELDLPEKDLNEVFPTIQQIKQNDMDKKKETAIRFDMAANRRMSKFPAIKAIDLHCETSFNKSASGEDKKVDKPAVENSSNNIRKKLKLIKKNTFVGKFKSSMKVSKPGKVEIETDPILAIFPKKYSILSNNDVFFYTDNNYLKTSPLYLDRLKEHQKLMNQKKTSLFNSPLKLNKRKNKDGVDEDEPIIKSTKFMNKESMLFRTHEIKSKLLKMSADDPKKSLFFYIKDDNFHKFKDVLEKNKISVESKDPDGNSLLNLSVQCNSYHIVDYLIANEADVNTQNHKHNTPLHYALAHKNFRVADLLIKRRADESVKNYANLTPWQCIMNTESIL